MIKRSIKSHLYEKKTWSCNYSIFILYKTIIMNCINSEWYQYLRSASCLESQIYIKVELWRGAPNRSVSTTYGRIYQIFKF